ncbi:uncharacterized protein LOC108682609 [Hyalella azteca]|uniref:Uncharacterized protein LOC108682609 n=1 Tax=Hyalella azteca TaxID=294128 RepID=A0A8B7PMS7_HYAAZ|nr:uncharacterized protein LOC108682609 [Hyalella azteca]
MGRYTSFTTVNPLQNPRYADFDQISRCVHFDDFEEAVHCQILVPQPLSNSHTRLLQQVLWFAPSQLSSEHNFYGNVSFTINWATVQQKLGPNLYLIDQAIYNSRSYTRVVLTANNYDGMLTRVDLDSEGSPMIKSWSGYRHASHCMNKLQQGPHELQIAIEVDDDDARWLYLNCQPASNNHSLANVPSNGKHARWDRQKSKFKSYKCFKFNTAQNIECPYNWTQSYSEQLIQMVLNSQILTASDTESSYLRTEPEYNSNHTNADVIPSVTVTQPQETHSESENAESRQMKKPVIWVGIVVLVLFLIFFFVFRK